jgi:hypothetical protein
MYWTLELASYLEDAPWPATKDELIDFSIRSGAPLEVVENLQELEDDGQPDEGRLFLQRRRILKANRLKAEILSLFYFWHPAVPRRPRDLRWL